MTKLIPRELIKHLEYVPGQQIPQKPVPVSTPSMPQSKVVLQGAFSIDALIKEGKPFYCTDKDSKENYIGVAVSLQQASEYAGAEGIVASMPYLIAGKSQADKKNYLWKDWFTANTEEDVGIDVKGLYASKGKPVLITLHGGGILTPDRIKQAYAKGLTEQNAAKLTDYEFDTLLTGILPSGENINIYTVEDVKKGNIPDPLGRYAVALDFEKVKSLESKQFKKKEFMENPLVLARAGTLEYLEKYFDKAKDSDGVGCWHRFNEIDASIPQGRVLFVVNDYDGLNGYDYLYNDGRFVGVAPEAHVAKK